MSNPEKISAAKELGTQAFRNGQPAAAALNPAILNLVADLKIGEGAAEIFKAYTNAWMTANLAEPFA